MSSIQRKHRPLSRDKDSFRDDRLFIVACDDTYAPKQYFDFFRLTRVQVYVVATDDGTSAAQHVLRRLLSYDREEGDELWLLLDVDHFDQPNHVGAFAQLLNDARRQGVNIALSKPSFELWLLLHHVNSLDDIRTLADAAEVEAELRRALGSYNKTRLRSDHFPLRGVAQAHRQAQILDREISGDLIPGTNTTRVYGLLQSIVDAALPSQLPEELRAIVITRT